MWTRNIKEIFKIIKHLVFPPWEFTSKKEMFDLLVGDYIGPHPEKKIKEIKAFKKNLAHFIYREVRLTKNETVMELGTGAGYVAYHIAPLIKKLYCCDISKSFIKYAKKECVGIKNISFHHIKPYDYSFSFIHDSTLDAVYAISVFIHFNLFDMFLYFPELHRVLKSGGRLWFDFENIDTLDLSEDPSFSSTAKLNRKDPLFYRLSKKWNSLSGIKKIAQHFGFFFEEMKDDQFVLFKKL